MTEEIIDPYNGKLVLVWEAPGYLEEGAAARLLAGGSLAVKAMAARPHYLLVVITIIGI